MVGGYKIIDLKGISITAGGEAVTIAGVYDAIESTNKATLIENLVIGSVEQNARFLTFKVDSGSYVSEETFTVSGTEYTLNISSDDEVSVVAVVVSDAET